MFETSVQMRLFSQLDHFCEVLVIYMGVHSEQTLQNCLCDRIEVFRKRHSFWVQKNNCILDICVTDCIKNGSTITDFGRKECFIIQLILYPCHQIIYIFGRRTLDWLFDCLSVGPMIFIFRTGRHKRTRLFCAELSYSAVKHIDLVKKVHSFKGKAFNLVRISRNQLQ